MISLIGVPLTQRDVETLEKALQQFKTGTISAGEYNSVLLRIKADNSKRPGPWRRVILYAKKQYWLAKQKILHPGVLASRTIYRERLETCAGCESAMYVGPTKIMLCRICGCALQAKARLADARCPATGAGLSETGKWQR